MARWAAEAITSSPVALTEWTEVRGCGVQARSAWGILRLGSFAWLQECGVRAQLGSKFVDNWTDKGATVIGLVVQAVGYAWVEKLMPPVVTGAIVAAIGLNLAPVAVKAVSGSSLDTWVGLLTVLAVGLVAVRAPGMLGRLPVLIGGLVGYVAYYVGTNVMGLGKPIDFGHEHEVE